MVVQNYLQEIPQLRQINAVASVIPAAAALTGVALTRPKPAASWRYVVLGVVWVGCSIATAHGIVGILTRAADIGAAKAGHQAPGAWLFWDLLLFEPWFLIEGVLLGIGGWFLMPDRRMRVRWLLACATGVCMAIAAAILRLKIY